MTASVGSGHTKAAQAVKEELQKYSTADIVTVDFMARETSALNWSLKMLYLKMLAVVPNIYDIFYKASAGGAGGAFGQHLVGSFMYASMKKIIAEHKPDAIVCTHPFPAGAASKAKEQGAKFFLATIMTDYSLHKLWVYKGTDFYFTATEKMRDELKALGLEKNKSASCGIPITAAFAHLVRRRETPPNILIMGGGLGLGGIKNTMHSLAKTKRNLKITVVVGKNEKLKEELKNAAQTSRHEIEVLGYTDKIAELMSSATVVVTKPGALTVSEAFAAGAPLVLHEPIPGPETDNARYASRCGAAVWDKRADVGELVEGLMDDPAKLAAMEKAARALSRPQAAKDIAAILAEKIGL